METKTVKIVAIPEAVNWSTKLKGKIVQDKARAEGVKRNKIIGYCDVVVSYPQKRTIVKKVVKEHITSFENGLLASGDQVMIDYNFNSCRRKAKVPSKVHDSQVSMDFINFRIW